MVYVDKDSYYFILEAIIDIYISQSDHLSPEQSHSDIIQQFESYLQYDDLSLSKVSLFDNPEENIQPLDRSTRSNHYKVLRNSSSPLEDEYAKLSCDSPTYSSRKPKKFIQPYDENTLKSFEQWLCNSLQRDSLGIMKTVSQAEHLKNLRWRCLVTLQSNYQYQIRFLLPEITRSTSLYYHILDSNRILNVEMTGFPSIFDQFKDHQFTAMTVFNKGIPFANRTYYFFGGKPKSKETAISCWFISEDPRADIPSLRNVFGSLTQSFLPNKCNARLKLGYSPIYLLPRSHFKVILVDDLVSCEGQAMTDGCGLISVSLLKGLPYNICHGEYNPDIIRLETMPSPAVIQIRCVIAGKAHPKHLHGLYKGCLLAVHDPNLCPEDTIIFRQSMYKCQGPTALDQSIIGIVHTFEHPNVLQSKDPEKTCSDNATKLNKFICLLLNNLGVKDDWFLRIISQELTNLKEILHQNEIDRESAYKLSREFVWDIDTTSDENPESYLDSDEVVSSGRSNIGESVLNCLLSGQRVDEPYLQMQLRYLIERKLNDLSRCIFRVRNAIYLVAVPDPYDILAPDEVFMAFPDDRMDVNAPSNRSIGFEGRVIVTRHPTNHPGDIRAFKAVRNHQLYHLNRYTNSGVIYFSVKGNIRPGDMMSGGDYDGDKYLVFYGFDSEIVTSLIPKDPFKEEEDKENDANEMKPSRRSNCSDSSCRECRDGYSVDIYLGLIKFTQESYVGRYTNAWFYHARRDILGKEALECAQLVRQAIDSAKTGAIVPFRPDLLIYSDDIDENGNLCPSSNRSFDDIISKIDKLIEDFVLEEESEVFIDLDNMIVDEDEAVAYEDSLVSISSLLDVSSRYYCGKIFAEWQEEMSHWHQRVDTYRDEYLRLMRKYENKPIHLELSETVNKIWRGSFEKEAMALFHRHRKYYRQYCQDISIKRNIRLDEIERRIAGLIYLASYYHEAERRNKGFKEYQSTTTESPNTVHRSSNGLGQRSNRMPSPLKSPYSSPSRSPSRSGTSNPSRSPRKSEITAYSNKGMKAPKYLIEYCWRVCGDELNSNKRRKEMSRQKSQKRPMLSSEFQILFLGSQKSK